MDRPVVYYGALARALDVLSLGQNAMVGLAKIAEAVLGAGTSVDGFTCTATAPASLTVNVGAGQVYQVANLESSAISLLQQDSHSIVKQGLLLDAQALTLTPPTTPGYSQAVLIQTQYTDSDTVPAVLNYYNAANPSVPLQGAGGNGLAQATVRKGVAQVTAKYGVATTAGSQVAPNPDAGWAPLFVVTLSYGQSAITAGNITVAANAPFIGVKLPAIPAFVKQGNVPQIATGAYTFYVNGGTGNDSNTGLTATTAFATIARAAQVAAGYYLNGQSITINVADGTYGRVVLPSITGGNVFFVGNSSSPANCTIASSAGSAILAAQTGNYTFTGFKVTTSGTGTDAGAGVQAGGTATVQCNNFEFGACAGPWVLASNGATVTLGGALTISGSVGSGQSGFRAQYNGSILTALPTSPSLNISAAVSGSSFIMAIFNGSTGVLFSTITNKGNFSGVKYDAEYNGIVNTSGGGANYYPGTNAGGVSTGGQYV